MEENNLFNLESSNLYSDTNSLNKDVVLVNLSEVFPNPDQPRKQFDEEKLEELSKSIQTYGVIQPIIVTKKGNKYFIIAGERRFRASKKANLKKIPVIVRNDLSTRQIDEIALIENIQRQDLNPIEEAKAYKRLIEEYDITQEALAEKLGKSRPVISNTIRLLNLQPEIQTYVEEGRLSSGHARTLLGLKDKTLQLRFAKAACDKQISVRQLETLIHNHLNPEKKKKQKVVVSTELKYLVNTMQRVFATNVKAIGNNTRGRIFIDYYTEDDLYRILELVEILRKKKNL